MTLKEIGALLDVGDSALRHAIRRQELTAEKVGPVWLVEIAAYERYKENRRPPGYPKGVPRRRPAQEETP